MLDQSAEPAWLTEAHSLLKITAPAEPDLSHASDDGLVPKLVDTKESDDEEVLTLDQLREIVAASNRVPVCPMTAEAASLAVTVAAMTGA